MDRLAAQRRFIIDHHHAAMCLNDFINAPPSSKAFQ